MRSKYECVASPFPSIYLMSPPRRFSNIVLRAMFMSVFSDRYKNSLGLNVKRSNSGMAVNPVSEGSYAQLRLYDSSDVMPILLNFWL